MEALGTGALELHARATSVLESLGDKGSVRLMGASTGDEVWAAAALIHGRRTIVIDTQEFLPLWKFVLRRLRVDWHDVTLVDEDHVPESNTYDLAISSAETTLGQLQVYTSRQQISFTTDTIVFSSLDSGNRTSHDVEPPPSIGMYAEEQAVTHARSINCITSFGDVTKLINRLTEARENEHRWKIKFRSKVTAGAVQREGDCPICLEPLNKRVSMVSSCKHTFCTSCLTEWLVEGDSCPLCRSSTLMGVEHSEPIQLACEMEPNPFYITVNAAIEQVVWYNNGARDTVAVASKFKYHPRAICSEYPDDFVLYHPGTIVEGMWIALARRKGGTARCICTESISERDSEILEGALNHFTRRPMSMHFICTFPLSRQRIKSFFMESE